MFVSDYICVFNVTTDHFATNNSFSIMRTQQVFWNKMLKYRQFPVYIIKFTDGNYYIKREHDSRKPIKQWYCTHTSLALKAHGIYRK